MQAFFVPVIETFEKYTGNSWTRLDLVDYKKETWHSLNETLDNL